MENNNYLERLYNSRCLNCNGYGCFYNELTDDYEPCSECSGSGLENNNQGEE